MVRRWIVPLAAVVVAALIAATIFCAIPVTHNGSSVRRAIALQVPKEDETFEEWTWIDEHCRYYLLQWFHAMMVQKARVYSYYRLETPQGPKEIYFDVREPEPTPSGSQRAEGTQDAEETERYDADSWKRSIDYQARREAAGKKAPFDQPWSEYWGNQYSMVRSSSGFRFPLAGLSTPEAMIDYIKGTLKSHGLSVDE